MKPPIVAVDIGSTKVACAVGLPREEAPGFELVGSSLVPYPSFSEAWLDDPLMVSRAIEQALDAVPVRTDVHRALVGVTHPALTCEQVRAVVPLADEPMSVRAQDLDRLRERALDHAVGIDREPLLVERLGCSGNGFDGVHDPRGLSATRLTGAFHVVTMPLAARRAIVQVVESAGLEVARLSYTLPALLASLGDESAHQRDALVVDVGGLTTDVGLFREGRLCVSEVVPAGGVTLAATIAKHLQVTMDHAMTWSLEGAACRKPEVRSLVTRAWARLERALNAVLKAAPRPDVALVGGRGALLDGFVEWLERTTGIPATLGRSPRTHALTDLSRQVGLSAVIGLLEMSTAVSPPARPTPSLRFFNRVIDRSRAILTEYF